MFLLSILPPPPLPGRRSASLWTSPLCVNVTEARTPPSAPVTQRIPVRTDAARVEATGALISVGLNTPNTRDGEKIARFVSVRSLRPRGTMLIMSLSAGSRT